jgi:hypothetical protein
MDDLDAEIIRMMCEDTTTRRELLWLRAKEKEDHETVADLERIDPNLAERMRDVEATIGDELDDRKRREAYAQAWHQRYDHHATRLSRR